MATVFVLDDDAFVARIYAAILRDDGYEVRYFRTAHEALEATKLLPSPDLIVADLLMAEMDGAEFARVIKSDNALRHIPIVLYSASLGMLADEDRHLFVGIYQKPLRPDEVQGSVRSALLPLATAHAAS